MKQVVYGREYLMMYESIWVVITALSRDHCIQLVHHGQQQLELVSWLLQMHKDKVAQNNLSNLHCTKNSVGHRKPLTGFWCKAAIYANTALAGSLRCRWCCDAQTAAIHFDRTQREDTA